VRKRARPLALDVPVPGEDLGYSVLVGSGLLGRVGVECRRLHPMAKKVALVSDANVVRAWGEVVAQTLRAEGFDVRVLVVPPGEASKCQEQLFRLAGELCAAEFTRRDVVVALGGGVVGDLAGCLAATYLRGLAFIQCPTSLLAQVDSSVGGKVAFHFPSVVIIDPDALSTLPDREVACGLSEMLKHGALFSQDHFQQVTERADEVFARDEDVLMRLIATSVGLKAACVGRDPRESGAPGKGRVLLNLGHTVGHALEKASGYALQHGEAVGLGLLAAARISRVRGVSEVDLEPLFSAALRRLRLPHDLDAWLTPAQMPAVEAALAHDKKRAAQAISYIALQRWGEPRVLTLTPAQILDGARGIAS
jgi:3-dehydroquinate synthetase